MYRVYRQGHVINVCVGYQQRWCFITRQSGIQCDIVAETYVIDVQDNKLAMNNSMCVFVEDKGHALAGTIP